MSCSIPIDILNVTDATYLVGLRLQNNSLTGPIPSEVGLLRVISEIDLSSNLLVEPLPSELGILTPLRKLSLSNNALSGAIPAELATTWGLRRSVEILDLSNNYLTLLPSEFGLMSRLTELDVSHNMIQGGIPSELGMLSNVRAIDVAKTWFSGQISTEIGLLKDLGLLRLSNMPHLSGSIPAEIWTESLRILHIDGSPGLSGTIPDRYCNIRSRACNLDQEWLMIQPDIRDYWWLEYKPDMLEKEYPLEFNCSAHLCGCDCPCI